MARAGATYPQVDVRAGDVVAGPIASESSRASVAQALQICEGADLYGLALAGRLVRRHELSRMVEWGRGDVSARDVAWTGLPVLPASRSEIEARRLLMSGAPLVVLREGRRFTGVIDRESAGLGERQLSRSGRVDLAIEGEARLWLLRLAGRIGDAIGAPAFAVGGFVRDLALGRAAPDVDLAADGDGIAFARRLSEAIGGRLVIHASFGTASIDGAAGPGGAALGRIDVASARRERYAQPGALPSVSAAPILDDLARRDFSVNAMALALSPSSFGALVDPCGGLADLARRRLRPLHPLSFVEDPTRVLRAARYAGRLGFRLSPEGRMAVRLALELDDYPALSGPRLRAELERLIREPTRWAALAHLLRWDALRLCDHGYRTTPASAGRLADAARLHSWADAHRIALDTLDTALLALLIDQAPPVQHRCLDRLAIRGQRRTALDAALRGSAARRLGALVRRSAIAEALRPLPPAVLAGLWLRGPGRIRRRIEWYLAEGRSVRPLLTGDDVVACGVPRGPAVGRCLTALRRRRVDRAVHSVAQERLFVKRWLGHRGAGLTRERKEAWR